MGSRRMSSVIPDRSRILCFVELRRTVGAADFDHLAPELHLDRIGSSLQSQAAQVFSIMTIFSKPESGQD
jgi:hypothetical protein